MIAPRLAPAVETAAVLLLGAVAIHLALVPASGALGDWPTPDLVFCLACAWALRRPAGAPLWAIVALGLAADLALDRPVGLGALALVAATEALRASAATLRSGPFVGEWLTVAGLALAWALSAHAAMQLVFLDGPGLPALLREAAATALAYPLVVLVLAWGVGMRLRRSPAAPARPGRLP
ncbi:rod shape-determining protein MreD [Amaricoccus sp.]|uniref:rod shape-determining protein MreD n=1 Tax=Amaricoccus sp. TaxID=1872485 RepID=UPI001B5FC8D4|nr:rod shape-determining protein MreD [Amaricoccus sp.]MBP7001012.1 rod shape-determining protein MreD [Amaricoccus sp.]